MRIEVLCFAAARDAVGTARLEIEVRDGDSVDTVVAALAAAHPSLGALRPGLRYAVNEEFVFASRPLHAGDTLAIIPPVSGG